MSVAEAPEVPAAVVSKTGLVIEQLALLGRLLESFARDGIDSVRSAELTVGSIVGGPYPRVFVSFEDFKRLFAGQRVQRNRLDTAWHYSGVIDDVGVSAFGEMDKADQPATEVVL